jgi:cytochrome c-type biogenesis protein CcmF
MGIVLVGLMAMGPVLAFGRSAATSIARRLAAPALVAVIVSAFVWLQGARNAWALACVAIATLGTATVIADFARSLAARRRSTGEGWVAAAARLIDRDHRRYGGQLAHLGAMMLVIGVAGSAVFSQRELFQMHTGEVVQMGRYLLRFDSLEERREVNYTAIEATMSVRSADGWAGVMRPQCRFYDAWGEEPNTEVAVRSNWRDDLYLSLAGWQDGGHIAAIEARVNPVVLWIWIGGIVMVLGAVFCAVPRLLPVRQAAEAVEPRPAADDLPQPAAPLASSARSDVEAAV